MNTLTHKAHSNEKSKDDSDISAVTLIICVRTDISATVTPVSLKVCTMVELCPTIIFSPFCGDIFKGLQMRGQEMGSGGPFLAYQTHIFAI